ncbi:hypothetical protein HpCK101_12090 [Helicobacter pylori]
MAAKEVMISTMEVLYSLGKDVDETNNDLKGIIAKNTYTKCSGFYFICNDL